MPEAVETYVKTRNFDEVRTVQNRLLMAYENNLSKHAPAEIVTKTRMVWNSIPTQLSRENKKFVWALTEQYVLQQLIVHEENDIFYWSAERGTGKIDFLVQMDDKIGPIKVKAEENLQAKRLRIFVQKYNMKYAVRTSMSDYREQEWMVNFPLYYIGNLNQYYQDRKYS